MSLRLIWCKTLWGVTNVMGNTAADGGYARLFKRIASDGFNALETPVWLIEDKQAFCDALKQHNLSHVAMINTCTPAGDNNGSYSLEDHLRSFRRQVREVMELPLKPLLINSHSGCDAWPLDMAKQFFQEALRTELDSPIPICHETHRSRVLFNPWVTRDLLRALPELKITADFSHFCVVAERVFDEQDAVWEDCLQTLASATRHIHARVGWAQGAQVSDPRAPENAETLRRHESWWLRICEENARRGAATLTVEPEFGTDGYQQRLPYSQVETADLWAVNSWMRQRLDALTADAPWRQR